MKCEFCKQLEFLKSCQMERMEDGREITYRYTSAIVHELIVDGEPRGRGVTYTWLTIKFCPNCGRKI